jgi:hemerythrin-like domain-containing protein
MTMMPAKRHLSIQNYSREHHFALLLCWKIKKGLANGVSPERIKRYTDWFYQNHLRPHFTAEEKCMYPVLGDNHTLVQQALAEHRALENLFMAKLDGGESLSIIQDMLEKHIRFEERVLFNEIQQMATPAQMQQMEELHQSGSFEDKTDDMFWNEHP